MKILQIPRIEHAGSLESRLLCEVLKKEGASAAIDQQPWESFSASSEEVTATCSIGYDGTDIFVLFQVRETEIRAVHTAVHEKVFEDSCVEFFVSDIYAQRYLNFELNPLGACLAGSGTCRADRSLLPADDIRNICLWSSYREQPADSGEWSLLACIPLGRWNVLGGRQDLSGVSLRGNVYKCGDLLMKRHYLAWNSIDLPEPDFHQMEFFGEFRFESETANIRIK